MTRECCTVRAYRVFGMTSLLERSICSTWVCCSLKVSYKYMQDSVSLDKLSLDSDRLKNYNYDYQKEIYIGDLTKVVVPLFPDNPPSALCECQPPLLLSAYSCSYSRGPLSLCWVLRNIRCLVKISFGQYPVGEMSSEDHSHRMWLPLPLLELGALGIVFLSLSKRGLERSYSLSSRSRQGS